MTVSDPLIKELKGWTRKLTEDNIEIIDDNENLKFLCICLEKCFQKGVASRLNSLGFPKIPEPWYWLEELAEKQKFSLYGFFSLIESVRDNEKLQTSPGRFRQLIRMSLLRKCLHVPVEFIVRTPSLSLEFYEPNSILGDEILGEIFLSVLLQISKLNFKLNLRNSSFLDQSWQLPHCVALELVPCKNLGISVCFTKGKALIVNLEENSVAAEDGKIKIGDVLDEINGNVITTSAKGKLRKIMKKTSGQPITLHIVQYHYKNSDETFGPIANLMSDRVSTDFLNRALKCSGSTTSVAKNNQNDVNHVKSERTLLNAGFPVNYCGSISTGIEGDVRQIEKAIWNLLRSGDSKLILVRFECLEMGVRVTQDADDAIIMKHSYMKISSCGRTANIPDYFAYIAGDTNCNVATKFEAFVFHHRNEEEVQMILQSLGQGFQRTHFAV
ncbi:uncharacterized protein LOC107269029 [Cephus cinctus]|uniref:Uncharacterized protein LOC107269029 n=1 Tax=Cephus cinctus TaxID=211228 RepID=A0AAJ7BYY4_CEPCN|nr:uncharacterized protein LOC107269029 [Cephus cinctus]